MEASEEVVEAIYPFAAANQKQLSMQQGDKIKVIQKHASGWWVGSKVSDPNFIGIFPMNYTNAFSDNDMQGNYKKPKEFVPQKGALPTVDKTQQMMKDLGIYSASNAMEDEILPDISYDISTPRDGFFKKQVEELKQQVATLSQENTKLKKLNTTYKDSIEKLKKENQNLQTSVEEFRTFIASSKQPTTPSSLPPFLSTTSSTPPPFVTSTSSTEVEKLKKELEVIQASNDKLLLENQQIRNELNLEKEKVKQNINTASQEAFLDTQVKHLQSQNQELQTQNQQLSIQLRSLQTQMNQLQSQNQQLQAQQQQTQQISTQYQQQIQRQQTEIQNLKSKADEMVKTIQEEKKFSSKFVTLQNTLKPKLTSVISKVRTMRKAQATLKQEAMSKITGAMANDLQVLTQTVSQFIPKYTDLFEKYKRECKARRKIFNQLQELKGTIRVYLRVRPLSQMEIQNGNQNMAVQIDEEANHLSLQDKAHGKDVKYEYERVFGPNSSQEQVFEDVEPLVTSILDGYNVCIFAYGQTGSGKTYTMEGPVENRGVNYRTLGALFALKKEREEMEGYKINIEASVMEIYNETVYDLLAIANTGNRDGSQLNILLSGQQVVVPNLTKCKVESLDQVTEVLNRGHKSRAVGANNLNEHSSRSHCIVSIFCDIHHTITNQRMIGKLHLIDLAGSERLKRTDTAGDRFKESVAINKSLSALGNVIQSLGIKKQHIPYRDSKLTSFLQDSLGGNSKILMFVNISPALENLNESICSLGFASRARAVEIGKAEVNIVK